MYFSDDDYQWLRQHFIDSQYDMLRLEHNAWFNGIYMAVGDWEPAAKDDPYLAQVIEDLTDFRDAPNDRYYLDDRDPGTYELDPFSVFLHDLMEEFPFLAELMGMVDYQAQDAFPVLLQCTTDFLWQRSPFEITACGSDDPTHVNPGADYLVAYWLASYHQFIEKDM